MTGKGRCSVTTPGAPHLDPSSPPSAWLLEHTVRLTDVDPDVLTTRAACYAALRQLDRVSARAQAGRGDLREEEPEVGESEP